MLAARALTGRVRLDVAADYTAALGGARSGFFMPENDDILSNLDRLIVSACPAPRVPYDTQPTLRPQGQPATSRPGNAPASSETAGRVYSAPPRAATTLAATRTDDMPTPWSSPLRLIEFEMLWTTVGVPIAAIAQHYRKEVRTIHRWRAAVGLLPRHQMLRNGPQFARVYAVRAQAVAGLLSPGAQALLGQASRRTVYFPWTAVAGPS